MTETLNVIKRPEGYKLYGPDQGVRTDYGVLGPDGLGRYFLIAQYFASSAVRLIDEHGVDAPFQQSTPFGTRYRCGAIDSQSRVWVGNVFAKNLAILDADGSTAGTLSLTDGSDTYEPWGMLFDEDDGFLYVVGQGAVNEGLQLFRVDTTPGSESILAWGGVMSSAVSPPPEDVLDVTKAPDGAFWTTDGSRTNALLRFDAGTMFPELITLSSPANRGLHRVHYAFDHLWVGSSSRHGIGSGKPQILKVTLDGTVVGAYDGGIITAQRFGGFASDGTYLYCAEASFFIITDTWPNRVRVFNPVTFSQVGFSYFGGSSPTSWDGRGAPPREVRTITEGEDLQFACAAFYDAALWIRGDDPELRSHAGAVRSLPNRGPQELLPALKASRALPGTSLLSGLSALDFSGDVQDLRIRQKPTYTTDSVGFNQSAGSERGSFGNSYDFDYLTHTATYSIWFRSSASIPGALYGKMDPATTRRGYALSLDSSGRLVWELHNDYGASNSLEVRTSRGGLNDGLWHHVAVVLPATPSASTVKIYVDSRDEPLTAVSDTLSATTTNTSDFWVGARSATSLEQWFQGHLCELAVFSVALFAGQVRELFNRGRPGNLTSHSAYASLTGWWRLGTGDTFPTLTNQQAGPNGTLHASMIAACINPQAPESEQDLFWLHDSDNELVTLAAALRPTGTGTYQTILSTLDETSGGSPTGLVLLYNGGDESIKLAVYNVGSAVYDYTTATGSVPRNAPVILLISLNLDDGALIRIWRIDQPGQYDEEEAPKDDSSTSDPAGSLVLGLDEDGAFEGQIGELVIWRRLLVAAEQLEVVRYLRRWL